MKIAALALLVLTGAILVYSFADLPATGDPGSPPSTHVSPRYIEKGYEETGTKNAVTAILADYRGYDTLGETVVIFTAGIATFFILRLRSGKSDS